MNLQVRSPDIGHHSRAGEPEDARDSEEQADEKRQGASGLLDSKPSEDRLGQGQHTLIGAKDIGIEQLVGEPGKRNQRGPFYGHAHY